MSDPLLETAAAEFVESFGVSAILVLEERAHTAEECRHRVAAGLWREMAEASRRILSRSASRRGQRRRARRKRVAA